MIKNIIFDFDGVLVDSEILVARAFSKYLRNIGHNFNQKDFFQFAGKKTIQVITHLSEKFLINDKEKFYSDIMDIASNIYTNELTAVKGAFEYVNKSERNLFIGSNSIKTRIIKGLKKVNLEKFFDQDKIFSFDMVNMPKPYPDIYLKVINTHSLNKEETIVIEDSVVGIQAAKAAEIKVIGLTAGSHWHSERSESELITSGAFKVINDYNSLDKILKIS